MTLGVGAADLVRFRDHGAALIGAVAYDTIGCEAIVEAGRVTKTAVILQVGSPAFAHFDTLALIAAGRSLAEKATEPVGLHLDHSRDLEEIRCCFDEGYSSVMIDGSHLPIRENIDITRKAVEIAAPYGAWVEAELGLISGDENRSTGDLPSGSLTKPDEASRFIDETGAHALAVCIGNVHGHTDVPVSLDLDLLESIRELVTTPLVLHGASGVDDGTLRDCARLGVAKINLNADLRSAYLASLEESTTSGGDDLVRALTTARSYVINTLVPKILLLSES